MLADDVVGLAGERLVVGGDCRLGLTESKQKLGARGGKLMAVRELAVEAVEQWQCCGRSLRFGDGDGAVEPDDR